MADEPAKIILGDTAISAFEESPVFAAASASKEVRILPGKEFESDR